MKTLIALTLILLPAFAQAKTDVEFAFCMKNVKDNYLPQTQAEIVCAMASNSEVGCGMDLVDMGQFDNLIEAVEYCKSPMGNGH